MKQGVKKFFAYARARHAAYHEKMAGKPRGQQTRDPVIGGGSKFTNVFRELDRTTIWFRENVRDRLLDKPEVLLATVLFRLLNRIEVGEAIFCQTMLPTGRFFKTLPRPLTAWDCFLASGDVGILRHAIISSIPDGPHATGAYIISSPPGYTKLDGILEVVHRFNHESREWEGLGAGVIDQMNWRGEDGAAELMLHNAGEDWMTLEAAWNWLKKFDYLGPFHSYEIVTDLRHTALLRNAPDIMTWANPGPGARRGLNRVHGRDKKDHSVSREGLIEEMRVILQFSKDRSLWPEGPIMWPSWEMRDVEHTLCEFDKYERIRLGEGRTRGVYR
jgi:hypothetical protein